MAVQQVPWESLGKIAIVIFLAGAAYTQLNQNSKDIEVHSNRLVILDERTSQLPSLKEKLDEVARESKETNELVRELYIKNFPNRGLPD